MLPASVKKKDETDGASTMDAVVKVAVSGARGINDVYVQLLKFAKSLGTVSFRWLMALERLDLFLWIKVLWKYFRKRLENPISIVFPNSIAWECFPWYENILEIFWNWNSPPLNNQRINLPMSFCYQSNRNHSFCHLKILQLSEAPSSFSYPS